MPAFQIWTLGCQMNVADSLKLAAGLERLGWQQAASEDAADLYVLNTCAVRQHAEDRAYGRLHELARRRARGERFQLAVMGCMVGPRTDELARRFPQVDAWARPQQFEPVLALAGVARDASEGEFWAETFGAPTGPTAYVPVVHGCDKFCTYCIVPLRRGRERSRPVADVLREVRHLAARGVREVTLLGQTVEAYGHDLPDRPDLATLFAGIESIDGIARVRFLTSYPKDMTDRIIDAVAELPKVCEHFNIPVQSGADAVLARMRRGYTVAEYEERVARIRRAMPEVSLATDVIVGSPGESEAEFAETIALLERSEFDVIHVAAYSPRPGTYAYRQQPDDVPAAVKRERLHAVEAVHAASAGRRNARLLGRDVEVLVERVQEGRASGRTRGGQIVHFDAGTQPGAVGPGALVAVTVDEVTPWSLQGRRAGELTLAVV
jgi:tRNA-2-methylthio-N6-dimethylallyladenosine synthase